jgi:hypothetical protein
MILSSVDFVVAELLADAGVVPVGGDAVDEQVGADVEDEQVRLAVVPAAGATRPQASCWVPSMSTSATTSPSSLLAMLCTVLDRFGNDATSPVHSGLPTVQTFPSPRSTRCLPQISTGT